MATKLIITKASGENEIFSKEKLLHSLTNAGASDEIARGIAQEVLPRLHRGISTKKIYQMSYSLLRRSSRHLAGRYDLKRGIMELGPSGFPFEQYIAALLDAQGYVTTIGKIVKGQCVTHEIDIIAEKGESHYMIECKYHNQPGFACDVKIPLYIQARFKDVEALWKKLPGHGSKFHQGWVVTNTRFTKDAIQYGVCTGLHLLGWDYPINGSLKNQIDELGLYPLTCLTTLTKREKRLLLDKRIVLCKEICNDKGILTQIGMNELRAKTAMDEGQQLCTKTAKNDKKHSHES